MKYLLFAVAVAVLIVTCLIALAWESFGTRPDDDDHQRFKSSPQYKDAARVFDNRRPNLRDEINKRIKFSDYFNFFTSGTKDSLPTQKLPEVQPEIQNFLGSSPNLKVIWLGHSSLLLNLRGKIILIDPVLSGSASPFSFMVKRFQDPVLSLDELPPVDYIVISHDHYDHLDMPTIKFYKNKKAKFFVPLGVGGHLEGWGISSERIVELDWWQSVKEGQIELVATPAQHFSGRDGLHSNETLWASWVLIAEDFRLFFSGDTGFDIHFKNIGEKYGPFDIAFLENGQYNEKWREVHILPSEQAQAFKDLKAKRLFPIHWGMFKLAYHSWYEPVQLLKQIAKEQDLPLVSPKIGEVIEINDNYKNNTWWEDLIQ